MAEPIGTVAAVPEAVSDKLRLDQTPLPLAGAQAKDLRLDALCPAANVPPSAVPASFPKVAGYEILAELGRGGMGVVYKARDLDLNRLVALKMILWGNLASAERRLRFVFEAATVARLQHANIVHVYDVGQHDAIPYIVLEYVGGGTLEERLKRDRFSPRQAAHLVEQLARAIHYAHTQGVVHRDLKPGNILLTEKATTDALPAFKISDFGLAKLVDAEVLLTESGDVMGTPGYMAPEQSQSTKGIGPAVDIHALGAILYELLSGRPPYRGATATATVLQVVQAEPVPPRRWQPRVPRDLEVICLKCLQKEPNRRYRSALELAEDLQRFRDGRPILARPAAVWESTFRWAKRSPAVAGLSAALALSSLCAVGSLAWAFALSQRLCAAERELELHAAARAQATGVHWSTQQESLRQARFGHQHNPVFPTGLDADSNAVPQADDLLQETTPDTGRPDLPGSESQPTEPAQENMSDQIGVEAGFSIRPTS